MILMSVYAHIQAHTELTNISMSEVKQMELGKHTWKCTYQPIVLLGSDTIKIMTKQKSIPLSWLDD